MKRLILLLLLVATGVFAVSEQELLARAESHYRAGNYLLALDEYGEFAASFPLSDRVGDAQYYRAVCLLRLDRPREALALIAEVQARYRSARYFQYVYFWEGEARLRLQEHERASQAFAQFLAGSQDPELAPQALLGKARAELALGNTAAAARDLEVLLRDFAAAGARPQAVVLLAYAYLKEGRANEVLTLSSDAAVASLAASSRELFRLYTAEALWGLGRRAEAVPLYSELRNAAPAVASVAYRRLFAAVEPEGDLTQMQSLLQQAEGRFAGSPAELEDLWVQIGIESVRQGRLELAEYFLLKVWERSPEGKRTLPDSVPLYLAEARLARGRLEEAAGLLAEYLVLSPARADRVLLRLGELRLRQARFTDAAELFERYRTAYPESPDLPEAGYRLAYARFRLGELDPALQLAGRLLAENPAGAVRPDLYRLLVAIQRRKGNLRQAASLLAAYASEYPADVKARLDLLRLYFSLREYPALVSESLRLQQVAGLKDSNPYAYLLGGYLRGLAETARKQYKNAQSALAPLTRGVLDKAGLAPVHPYALYYQAWAAYRLAQVSEARAKAGELLEGYPDHALFPSALYLAGWASYTLEDYRAAAAYFARLAKLEGELAVKALFLNGKSLAGLGQNQEAAQAFRTLFTVHPQSDFADDALFEYAGLLAERGQNVEAAAAYRDLVQRYPANPLAEEAVFKRAEVFGAAKSWQQARDAYLEYRTRFPKGRLVDAALYWGGIASAELGESFGAVLQWEKLADGYKSSPFRADALRRTAEAYAERGDYGKAVALLTALYKEYPEEAKAFGTGQRLEELAYRLQGAGEREAALSSEIGREGGAQTAKGRQAMIELAQLYLYEGSSRLELAPPMLQSVADKKEPATAARAQYLLGEYWFRKRDPTRAAQEFLKAAVLNPQDADRTAASLYRAAEMMKLASRPQDVRDLVARLEKFFPGSQWTAEARKLQEGGAQ